MFSSKIKIGAATHAGFIRRGKANQDAIKVLEAGRFSKKPHLIVLADGMGGHKGGEVASKLVVDAIAAVYNESRDEDYLDVLESGVQRAHFQIQSEAAINKELEKMGSTVVAGLVEKENLWLINAGDSRAYLIRDGEVTQISYDHTWVNLQVASGAITPEEAAVHPKRHVLSMSINASRDKVETFKGRFDLQSGDVVVLCSDGLWGTLSRSQIKAVAVELSPEEAADKLVQMANASSSPDNISVIIAKIN